MPRGRDRSLGYWMIVPAPGNISARLMARVLLVEDEPNIASIIVFKLEREGHQVRWESSAAAAPGAADADQPDLILLDSSLPDGDAFTLLTTLVADRPVVMMTEFRDVTTPQRARVAGAVATVEKPFKPTQLARLVAQLVPATAGRP
jgi:two-component system, OmpR family, response regulator MtrA